MWISQRRERAGSPMNLGCPASTARSDEVIASSGITFHLWRLYQHAWLICLIFPLASVVRESHSPWRLIPGLLVLLFYAASYTWLMWPHPVSQGAQVQARSLLSFPLFLVLSALVLVLSLVDGPAWLWLFIGTSAIAGLLLPMRAAFAAIVLFTLLPLFITVGMYGGIMGVNWWWLIALMLLVRGLGLDMIGIASMGAAIRELHTTRRELARLQVEEERLRLSRDLHDLLGQTLSTITLKSELARHLVTEDPDRCVQELSEIEHVARVSLREVREAVAGYRHPRLISELEGARQLLSAAGIDMRLEPMSSEALPPEVSAALAWTVREGVTNVIRHSRAQHCLIRLTQQNGRAGALVLNDGGARVPEESTARPGLGLVGLRERVGALGGRLEAGPLALSGAEHFRLWVELPMKLEGEAQRSQEGRS